MQPSKRPMSMASRMASVSLTRRCLDRRRAKTVLWRRTQVEGHSLQNCDVHQRFNSVRRLQYLPTRAETVATTWADGTPVTPRGRLVHTLWRLNRTKHLLSKPTARKSPGNRRHFVKSSVCGS